jgi:hypothetical protein
MRKITILVKVKRLRGMAACQDPSCNEQQRKQEAVRANVIPSFRIGKAEISLRSAQE